MVHTPCTVTFFEFEMNTRRGRWASLFVHWGFHSRLIQNSRQ